MRKRQYASQADRMIPETPADFRQAMQQTMGEIEARAAREENARVPLFGKRRAVALVLVSALLLTTAALATAHWNTFDVLGFMTGYAPQKADDVMQSNLYQATVNNVEITLREAGYDGRTLYIQYAYRMLDVNEKLGNERGYISDEEMDMLAAHNVGWWIDHLWIDGKCVDMPNNSGGVTYPGEAPGEIVQTEYWRLDNVNVQLSGETEISLPIGECQPLADFVGKGHPEKYGEDGRLLLPDKGMVTFTLDASDVLSRVRVEHPKVPITVDGVTVQVEEVCYSPLTTYLTLSLDCGGSGVDIFDASQGAGSWITSLELVDGNGTRLFPKIWGNNGYGMEWAEFIYPCIDPVPDEMYLAPWHDDVADMDQALKVK